MDAFRQYVLSVLCCSLICALLPLLAGSGKKALRLVCGIFLTITVVTPVLRLDTEKIWNSLVPEQWSEDRPIAEGEAMAKDSMAEIIKQACQAYILDKAGTEALSVTVRLSDDDVPVPMGVVLQGTVSPQTRQQLTEVLAEELGIPEEAQQWIG